MEPGEERWKERRERWRKNLHGDEGGVVATSWRRQGGARLKEALPGALDRTKGEFFLPFFLLFPFSFYPI